MARRLGSRFVRLCAITVMGVTAAGLSCSSDQIARVAVAGLNAAIDAQDDSDQSFGDWVDSQLDGDDSVDFGDWLSEQVRDW